ncbi:MAG TPA: ABC transporter substrate-binding protein, partial [Steroidobacteraceae bacterium]
TQFQEVSRIETPDPLTVRLVTRSHQATLPTWFANYNTFVIWRNSAPDTPIGSGPFTLVAQERGTSIELAAFDKFYKPGLPKLRGITFVAYADENLRASALRAGDVDMIEYVPWQVMPAIEADPRLRLQETQGAAFMDVLFNGTCPPFSDPRVRRAVAHAVKREDIVRAAFYGRGQSLEGVPITEGTPFYDDRLAHGWNYDPVRAKALLADAGYAGGLQTTLLATAQYGMHQATAEVVQRYLAAIGIQCELRLPDWATRVNLGTRGQYDIAIHGVAADNNDPDGLTPVMDTSLAPSQGRSFGVQAPRTVDAFARGRAEYDQAKRVQIYKELQEAALEEVPLVGLAWRSQGYGMDKRVTGFTNLPGALSTSSGVMLEETAFV